jgi:hypothetical protein
MWSERVETVRRFADSINDRDVDAGLEARFLERLDGADRERVVLRVHEVDACVAVRGDEALRRCVSGLRIEAGGLLAEDHDAGRVRCPQCQGQEVEQVMTSFVAVTSIKS